MVYRILALDPGGTTGWASYTANRIPAVDGPEEYYDETFDCGQIGPEEHHGTLHHLLGAQQTLEFVLVVESFEFRNMDVRHRDNINLMSREYIGVAKLFAEQRMIGPMVAPSVSVHQRFVLQTAGLAKGFIPDKGPQANKKIKDAGLWYPNQKHAMDAMRHLLWYLVNRDNRYDLVRKWWHK
jgi:hypothetical protein